MTHTLIAVTTWSRNRKHLAPLEALTSKPAGGQAGRSLCDASGYDQAWMDRMRTVFSASGRRQIIADLAPCKRCEKAAARLEQSQT